MKGTTAVTIDYTKLHNQIVKQAYVTLNRAQFEQMIQDKVMRAQAELTARQLDNKSQK
jgi:hypothetical protein